MKILIHILNKLFEEILCSILFTGLAFFVFLQVIMRYMFHYPLSWTDELAVYCMVWLVYLGASFCIRERAHIRVVSFINLFGRKTSTAIFIFSDLLWLGVCIIMVFQGFVINISFWEQPYLSSSLGIDQKWPYLVIPVGFGLMIFRLLQVYYMWLRHGHSLTEKYNDGGKND